jgi:hypothetical protein
LATLYTYSKPHPVAHPHVIKEKSLEEQRQKKLNWMGDVSFFGLCFLELLLLYLASSAPSLFILWSNREIKLGKNINIGSRSCSLRNSRV